jgi:hypothetical protein
VALRFILRSPNKAGGTGNLPEHQAIPFVDGVGNAETREETSMSNRFLISVAAAALIAGTGLANAQGTGMGRDAGSPGSAAQQSAPSSERGGGASSGTMQRDTGRESGGASDMKSSQSDQKSKGAEKNQRAEDQMRGGKEMKAEGKEDRGGMKSEQKAEQKSEKGQTTGQGTTQRDQSTTQQRDQTTTQSRDQKAQGQQDRTQTQTQTQGGAAGQTTTTTGQAGAGAKLSTEQRTQITSVIKEQRVQPVTNVNFSISVGTRVPRDVTFHTLPERVVTIYPEWRRYKYILVKEQIVIVDPNTYEIVAVLEV